MQAPTRSAAARMASAHRSFARTAVALGAWTVLAASAQNLQASGHMRLQTKDAQTSTLGPLSVAQSLTGATPDATARGSALEAELKASGHGITLVATAQQSQWPDQVAGQTNEGRAWTNELYASHDAAAWQYSAGKKIVSWDVGYAFRPNDMVQQEGRLSLLPSTPEGRPILMAEHFDADSALSVVAVHPGGDAYGAPEREPALAARYYQRAGSADWYGFARVGQRTGASLGSAVAWVSGESLELHGSVRYSERVRSQASSATGGALLATNPWSEVELTQVGQATVGATWTDASQLSLLVEAWYDGAALSDSQWDDWAQRNRQLAALAHTPAPAAAVAGNLSWQAQAFSVARSLRRSNVLMRLSWQSGAWQPALDLLYSPADQGLITTASLQWQGDRVLWQAGWRVNSGPDGAVVMQLPTRQTAYASVTWAF